MRTDSVYTHRRDQEVYKEEVEVIISRKRLEEMIAGRMEQKERERMLFQRMEDLENNFNRRMRELYGELSDMRCRFETLSSVPASDCVCDRK